MREKVPEKFKHMYDDILTGYCRLCGRKTFIPVSYEGGGIPSDYLLLGYCDRRSNDLNGRKEVI